MGSATAVLLLNILATLVQITIGEHLRAHLQGGDERTASARRLLTARDVLTSSLHEDLNGGDLPIVPRRRRRLGDTVEGPSPQVIHMHIPKTAGSSWRRHASEIKQTTGVVGLNVSHDSQQEEEYKKREDEFLNSIYSRAREMNVTIDDLDEQTSVMANLLEALGEGGEELNHTSVKSLEGDGNIEGALVAQSFSASRAGETAIQLLSSEACLDDLVDTNQTTARTAQEKGFFLATLLREPVAHVQSMYLKCKYDWRANRLKDEERGALNEISSWVSHYIQHPTENWACYNPANMQTRAFSCKGSRHVWYDLPDQVDTHRRRRLKPPAALELAKERMALFDFVGIAERFHESLCVFSAIVTSRAPKWCNCSDTKAWTSFKIAHKHAAKNIPDHNVSQLTETQRGAIQQLTSADAELYSFAEQRFDEQVAEYEKRGVLKVSCK